MTTKTREVTMAELAQAFEGKHINVSYGDRYGIVIEMAGGMIEYEDNELWITGRDNQNNVIGSICICGDAIEAIEEENGIYAITTNLNIPDIEITECTCIDKLRAARDRQQEA